MKTLFAGPVEKRVMAVMKTRIANAEKEHENKSAAIDEQCDQEIDAIEERRENDKLAAADALVEGILGK